jgi:hypothetical protein
MTEMRETPRDRVRAILQEALANPEEMRLDDLVDEIMEASGADGLKNYAIGFLSFTFMRRDGIQRDLAEQNAESALRGAGLI